MAVKGNLEGTLEDDFFVGDEKVGLRRDPGNDELYIRDDVAGEYPLTQLIAGVGLGYAVITTEGGLVYDTNGDIVIKVTP